MRFFSQFPLTDYKINGSNINTSLIDIYRHVDVNETLIDDITGYRYYDIKDGERPDVVSHKLYGNPEYHWTFFVANEKLNSLDDWPRSYNEQISYIDKKYDEYSVLEFIPTQEYIGNLYALEGEPPMIDISGVYEGSGEYSRISEGIFNESRWILRKLNGENVILSIVQYVEDSETTYAWTIRNEDPLKEPFLRAPSGNLLTVSSQIPWLITDWFDVRRNLDGIRSSTRNLINPAIGDSVSRSGDTVTITFSEDHDITEGLFAGEYFDGLAYGDPLNQNRKISISGIEGVTPDVNGKDIIITTAKSLSSTDIVFPSFTFDSRDWYISGTANGKNSYASYGTTNDTTSISTRKGLAWGPSYESDDYAWRITAAGSAGTFGDSIARLSPLAPFYDDIYSTDDVATPDLVTTWVGRKINPIDVVNIAVDGAGIVEANGDYVRNGVNADGNPKYTLYKDGEPFYEIRSTLNQSWQIGELLGGEFNLFSIKYEVQSTSTTVPTSGWSGVTGSDPVPSLNAYTPYYGPEEESSSSNEFSIDRAVIFEVEGLAGTLSGTPVVSNFITQPVFSFGEDSLIKYNNYFNDIDFTDKNLRLRVKNQEFVAETVAYDSERLQVWVNNISHNSFLSNDEQTYVLDYVTDSETERNEWLTNSILPWVRNHHRDVYNNLISDVRIIDDNILPYVRGSFNNTTDITYSSGFSISSYETDTDVDQETGIIDVGDFIRGSINVYGNDTAISLLYSDYLKNIELKTSRSWLKSYNAPYSYSSDDEYITTYDALTADANNSNYITYFSAEEEENESKRSIRVLRDSDVQPFADYYKELINE